MEKQRGNVMSPALIGLLSVFALLLLIFFGMPVAFATALVGIAGIWIITGWQATASIISIIPWEKVTIYTLTVTPMFVVMGNLTFHSGFGRDAFQSARQWVGQFPGGLAQATVLGSAFFGAATGSTVAAAATMGRIAVPEMQRYGYSPALATGAVAAAGPLAAMIPPSIGMVLFGMVTEQSVGKLLIAGYIPGFLNALVFMGVIFLRCWRNPSLGDSMPAVSWKERLLAIRGLGGIFVLSLFVMGGIYTGVVTPTEAGALGAAGALLLGFATRRLNLRSLWASLLDTANTVGMIFATLIGAFLFNALFALTRLPQMSANFISALPVSPIGILIAIMVFYIILGTFMDPIAMLFLTMPTIFPIAVAMGWNPIWFGILFIHVYEIGMITPPFGLTLFATKAVVPDVSMEDIIRGIVPFLLADIVVLALFITFPDIILFLPNTMKG